MRAMLTGLLCGVASVMTGCNVVGPAMMIAHGPPKTDAQHTLEKERTTVVFIDDPDSFLPRRSLRQEIAATAGNSLLAAGALTKVIEPRAALAASAGEQAGQALDLTTLAKNVQADVMIYARVTDYRMSPDGSNYLPSAALRVKVIVVSAAQPRVWPKETPWHTLVVQESQGATQMPTSAADMMRAHESLAIQMGDRLAKLFYEHETRSSVKTK